MGVITTNSTPFCDQKFKSLRVYTDFSTHLLCMVAYNIASYSSFLFSKKAHQFFENKSFYHHVAAEKILTYIYSSHNLIDFSINVREPEWKELFSNEESTLTNLVGTKTIDLWLKRSEVAADINKKDLKLTVAHQCFGMMLTFNRDYLQETQVGKAPFDAIKAISHKYRNGAPNEAILAQIFFRTIKEKARSAPLTIQKADLAKEERKKSLNRELTYMEEAELLYPILDGWRAELQQLVMKELGIESDGAPYFGLYNLKDSPIEKLKSLLDEYPDGVYGVELLNCKNASAHALSLIKAGTLNFLFDSTTGIFRFDNNEEIAELFYKISSRILTKGPDDDQFRLVITKICTPI